MCIFLASARWRGRRDSAVRNAAAASDSASRFPYQRKARL
jgi:hypothetical protein